VLRSAGRVRGATPLPGGRLGPRHHRSRFVFSRLALRDLAPRARDRPRRCRSCGRWCCPRDGGASPCRTRAALGATCGVRSFAAPTVSSIWHCTWPVAPRTALDSACATRSRFGRRGDAVVEMHHAAGETALVEEVEADPEVAGQGGEAGPDDDRRDQQVVFVHEAGSERLSAKVRAAHSDVLTCLGFEPPYR